MLKVPILEVSTARHCEKLHVLLFISPFLGKDIWWIRKCLKRLARDWQLQDFLEAARFFFGPRLSFRPSRNASWRPKVLGWWAMHSKWALFVCKKSRWWFQIVVILCYFTPREMIQFDLYSSDELVKNHQLEDVVGRPKMADRFPRNQWDGC